MAGTYPNAPGARMAYDRDGSKVVVHNGVSIQATLTQAQMQALNDESDSTYYTLPSNADYYVAVLFGQLRNLAGWGARFGALSSYQAQYSTNTTDGINGTWTNIGGITGSQVFDTAGPGHRTGITVIAQSNINAIRFMLSGLGSDLNLYGIQLYGSIVLGQVPDSLMFTDRLGNALTPSFLDWGDVAQGESADLFFAINNLSSKTANYVVVGVEALTDTMPSVPAQHLVSLDGQLFGAQQVIQTISPGGSQNLVLRRVTPEAAALSVWDARLFATVQAFI